MKNQYPALGVLGGEVLRSRLTRYLKETGYFFAENTRQIRYFLERDRADPQEQEVLDSEA
jgi:hypothetical protein